MKFIRFINGKVELINGIPPKRNQKQAIGKFFSLDSMSLNGRFSEHIKCIISDLFFVESTWKIHIDWRSVLEF